MSQRLVGTVAHEWPRSSADITSVEDGRETADTASRTRTRAANLALGVLCSIVASLAVDPVDRTLLFEQYDFKLWSQKDRVAVFCLSLAPTLLAMATVLVAFKATSKLRSMC